MSGEEMRWGMGLFGLRGVKRGCLLGVFFGGGPVNEKRTFFCWFERVLCLLACFLG